MKNHLEWLIPLGVVFRRSKQQEEVDGIMVLIQRRVTRRRPNFVLSEADLNQINREIVFFVKLEEKHADR
jgi:hypothetical protein